MDNYDDMIIVEQCEQCDQLWPAGSLQKAIKTYDPSPFMICPDCVTEVKKRERKIVDRRRDIKKISKE